MNEHQVLAAVAIVVVLALAMWLSLRGMRRAEELAGRQDLLAAELAATRDALAQSEATFRDFVESSAQRNADIEDRLARILEQQEQLRLLEEGSGSYTHAIRLAQHGASADELARDCGLNRGEAELLVSLHGRPGKE